MDAWSTRKCQSAAAQLTSRAAAPSPTQITSEITPSNAFLRSAVLPTLFRSRSMPKRSASVRDCRCRTFPQLALLQWGTILHPIKVLGKANHYCVMDQVAWIRRLQNSFPFKGEDARGADGRKVVERFTYLIIQFGS